MKPREMGGKEESGQSTDLLLPSCRFPGEVCFPLPRATAPVTVFPAPCLLWPPQASGWHRLLAHEHCSIHCHFSCSLATLCVKFLTLFLSHSSECAVSFLLWPCLIHTAYKALYALPQLVSPLHPMCPLLPISHTDQPLSHPRAFPQLEFPPGSLCYSVPASSKKPSLIPPGSVGAPPLAPQVRLYSPRHHSMDHDTAVACLPVFLSYQMW